MSLHARHELSARLWSACPVDFTEALLLVGIALGAKALGLW